MLVGGFVHYKINIKVLFECVRERERENKKNLRGVFFFFPHAAGTKGGKVGEMLIIYVIVEKLPRRSDARLARRRASVGAVGRRGCVEERGAPLCLRGTYLCLRLNPCF